MLFPESDKGKTLASLKKSRKQRAALIAFFGGRDLVPSSVMRPKKIRPEKIKHMDEQGAKRSYQSSSPNPHMPNHFNISGKGAAQGALSIFPPDIGRSILLTYSNPGDVVVDPFAGHNSRMDLCIKNGRHYVGCDLSAKFMDFNFKRADQLREKYPKAKIKLFHTDSRKQPIPNEVGNFTITSPPYYDIEYYGDEDEQLGKCPTYTDFLKGMKQVLRENFRTLKPGAYSAWFVNDFRRKGVFHFYHVDLVNLARKVGFEAQDILIVDYGRGFRDIFVNQILSQKIIPKRHEYGLVFRKPL